MTRILLIFLFTSILFSAAGQDVATPQTQSANCTQVLRLARAVYEQGRLHELEGLLARCLDQPVDEPGNFTTQEKVDALRLLCLSYIYLEEPAKADTAMLRLLKTDHFFALNTTDPAEFQALYGTFRTEPVFAWGVKLAGNYTLAHIKVDNYVGSESAGQGKYVPAPNFCAGVFIDREFFGNKKKTNPLRWTSLRLEAFWYPRAFNMKNPQLSTFKSDPGSGISASAFEGKHRSIWIDINLLIRYRYNHESAWDPYFGLGPGVSLLTSAKINQAKLSTTNITPESDGSVTKSDGTSYSGPSIDVLSAYNKIGYTLTAAWGVNRRFGAFYINGEIRYQYGFTNLINQPTVTVQDLLAYKEIMDGYNQSNIMLSLGFTIPKYIPKKLTNRKRKR